MSTWAEVARGRREGYKIAQVSLGAPFLVMGHKMNLRTYILVTCEGAGFGTHPTEARTRWYMHNSAGKIYYTPEKVRRGARRAARAH